MTDEQLALRVVSQEVQDFTRQNLNALTMLYGRVGHAKNPKDAAAFADGRTTLIAKLSTNSLESLEAILAHLAEWSANNLK